MGEELAANALPGTAIESQDMDVPISTELILVLPQATLFNIEGTGTASKLVVVVPHNLCVEFPEVPQGEQTVHEQHPRLTERPPSAEILRYECCRDVSKAIPKIWPMSH